MNKIIILILFLLLSSCAQQKRTETLYDGTKVNLVPVRMDEPAKAWQHYQSSTKGYKVFGNVVLGPGGGNWVNFATEWPTIEKALDSFHKRNECLSGCIITHIGNEKLSLERQKEIARKYYTDAVVGKLFLNSNNFSTQKQDNSPGNRPKTDWLNKYNDNDIIPAGSGTGFFISRDGILLSNYHVIQGCTNVALYHNGVKYPSNIVASDRTNDIAILSSSKKPNQYFRVDKDGPNLLEEIFVAGYPLGLRVSNSLKVSSGRVSSLAGYGDNYANFQLDAAINPGNSGGPIINKKGNVVGIAVAYLPDAHGFNFGIKSSTVNSFVNSNKINFSSLNMTEMSSRELTKLMNEATVFLECSMRVKDIKAALEKKDSKKVFYSDFNN
jgi:hypothetical protein